jgi:hypothetical protein
MIFRQTISMFLVVHLLLMTWIPVLIFKQQQYNVRKEMKWYIKNGVPENERLLFYADKLQADAENLTWIHDWEFRYHGEMYDILEKNTVDGKLVYVCIHDVKESGLFAQLDSLVEKAMKSNTPLNAHSKAVNQFFASLFYEQNTESKLFNALCQEIFFFWAEDERSSVLAPEPQPPENLA